MEGSIILTLVAIAAGIFIIAFVKLDAALDKRERGRKSGGVSRAGLRELRVERDAREPSRLEREAAEPPIPSRRERFAGSRFDK